ncbi:hypothetical protein CXG81DRAFT_27511 [Caulochytrium protostelioides]|uniref:UV-stimulated scaffold protein A C-terminal domain-containing protein n=1 Tax=Caulochytrium protostelioides TaxID=1555241 RepID=A0A4P9X3X3_9FUNG|nr:hypothetical protein CXG81DRAFT_27511 [Caulochytrium protostelioides]|eukprot:RKO99747.1 hypothetical protein CXG81DRAFT_27511 [Caulochytrium protostelioides]
MASYGRPSRGMDAGRRSASDSPDASLADQVQWITTRGLPELDPAALKRLKAACRRDDAAAAVEAVCDAALVQAEAPHAQIRVAALQLIDVLFMRSHAFRQRLMPHLDTLVLATAQPPEAMPPPRRHALRCRHLAYEAVQRWHAQYGGGYPAFRLALDALRHGRPPLDLLAAPPALELEALTPAERARRARGNALRLARWRAAWPAMAVALPLVQENLDAMHAAFRLLIPEAHADVMAAALAAPSLSTAAAAAAAASSTPSATAPATAPLTRESVIRDAGLATERWRLTIDLRDDGRVKECDANTAIFQVLREGYALAADKHRPRVEAWLRLGERVTLPADASSPSPALPVASPRRRGRSSTADAVAATDGADGADVSDVPLTPTTHHACVRWLRRLSTELDAMLSHAVTLGIYEGALDQLDRHSGPSNPPGLEAHDPPDDDDDDDDDDGEADDDDDEFEDVDPHQATKASSPAAALATTSAAAAADPAAPTTASASASTPHRSRTTRGIGARGIFTDFRDQGGADPTVRQTDVPRVQATENDAPAASTASPSNLAAVANPELAPLFAAAPVVPYADDLYYWDKTEVPLNPTGIDHHHRFLGDGDGDAVMGDAALAALKRRTRVVQPEAPRYIPPCNAPLASGRGLCRRRDLETCPVHGPIIPRDPATGVPRDPDAARAAATVRPVPEWQRIEARVRQQFGLRDPAQAARAARKRRRAGLGDALEEIPSPARPAAASGGGAAGGTATAGPATSTARLARRMDQGARRRRLESRAVQEAGMRQRERDAFRW